MGDSEKLVVYYSCFNYEVDPQEFPHIELLRNSLLSLLGEDWRLALQRELEFLNIRLAKYCLEVLIEIFLSIIQKSYSIDFATFKQTFKDELSLNSIWTEANTECACLESLLNNFFLAMMSLQIDINLQRIEFKVLPSARIKSQLQPLIVAQEELQTFASRVCKVLKRASLPLEAIIGPETLSSLSRYIDSLSNRVLSTFQVTSQFVTNIIEVNPFNLNVKVRVIQPARDFYDKAIEIWLALGEQLNPTEFVLSIKAKMGACWTEKLLNPALHFYEIAKEE
mmetsp:Transcript_14167/g.14234  ORF Transcript_14167/g.14234 Transcript_14167/m.14234 type:complete len:281 (-) Transcript_14167:144-986(-)